MCLQSIKSVKHNAARSVDRSILKKSRHLGFGIFMDYSSMQYSVAYDRTHSRSVHRSGVKYQSGKTYQKDGPRFVSLLSMHHGYEDNRVTTPLYRGCTYNSALPVRSHYCNICNLQKKYYNFFRPFDTSNLRHLTHCIQL